MLCKVLNLAMKDSRHLPHAREAIMATTDPFRLLFRAMGSTMLLLHLPSSTSHYPPEPTEAIYLYLVPYPNGPTPGTKERSHQELTAHSVATLARLLTSAP